MHHSRTWLAKERERRYMQQNNSFLIKRIWYVKNPSKEGRQEGSPAGPAVDGLHLGVHVALALLHRLHSLRLQGLHRGTLSLARRCPTHRLLQPSQRCDVCYFVYLFCQRLPILPSPVICSLTSTRSHAHTLCHALSHTNRHTRTSTHTHAHTPNRSLTHLFLSSLPHLPHERRQGTSITSALTLLAHTCTYSMHSNRQGPT